MVRRDAGGETLMDEEGYGFAPCMMAKSEDGFCTVPAAKLKIETEFMRQFWPKAGYAVWRCTGGTNRSSDHFSPGGQKRLLLPEIVQVDASLCYAASKSW